MPLLGADMEAGTLVEWRVKPGDEVVCGDIVALVETQKGVIEVETFESGTVETLFVSPGAKVPVGTPLASISGKGERVGAPPTHWLRASPAARAAAARLGVELSRVSGTGPGGAILMEDVERAARVAPVARAEVSAPSEEDRRESMRQAIAAAMSRSNREIPHYYLDTRFDVGRALDWLHAENERRPVAERMLLVVLFLKAVGLAVQGFPELNGSWVDGAFRPSRAVHLGVVISLRQGGAVVPTLHDVPDKPLGVLMHELGELIHRARRGMLRSSELADSTITVSSLGESRVERVLGVIFPPQVALVGFGAVREEPWVVEGRCVPRPLVTASLAADHRASDGHRGAAFLSRLERLLQEPETL